MSSRRAQSEVIGVVILIGVVVTMVGIVSVVVLSDAGTDESILADVSVEANGTHLSVTHIGGEGIPTDEVVVVVRGSDRVTRFAVDGSNLTADDGDGDFEFGESLVRGHGHAGGDARILVVHRPTNEGLAEAAVRLDSEG